MFKRLFFALVVASLLAWPSAAAPATPTVDDLITEPGFSTSQADMLRLYRAFFDREPDDVGAAYWLRVAEEGASLDVIAESFAASTEFTTTYGATTDEQFLEIVYRNVLGRDYDQGGFQYWLGQLQTQLSRGGTVRWVAANDEFVAKHPYPAQSVRVSSVTDGDSLVLADGRSIRLAQVDGPEYNECFGTDATRYLRDLVDGREVFLRRPDGAPTFDAYGRTVADVLIMQGDRLVSVNEAIVADGYGEYDESFAHEDPALGRRLAAAESSARAAGRGLWTACAATPQQVPVQPVVPSTPTTPGAGCHPAYTPCVPPPAPDLDCKDIGHPVQVNHAFGDPHRLDGDADGVGCESYR
ncbi:MAG: DUF4214 domain-containing protein [Acidimicrobiales bacterium]